EEKEETQEMFRIMKTELELLRMVEWKPFMSNLENRQLNWFAPIKWNGPAKNTEEDHCNSWRDKVEKEKIKEALAKK
ncbi:hypothetical protein HHI36_010696, partial [Cryptolaemus montrouzieri]